MHDQQSIKEDSTYITAVYACHASAVADPEVDGFWWCTYKSHDLVDGDQRSYQGCIPSASVQKGSCDGTSVKRLLNSESISGVEVYKLPSCDCK